MAAQGRERQQARASLIGSEPKVDEQEQTQTALPDERR